MHVSGFTVDLNWFLQFIVTAFIVAVGLLYLVKNTASKYFVVDSGFDSSDADRRRDPAAAEASMPGVISTADACVVCGKLTTKHCSACKIERYCSEACQRYHWLSEHRARCSGKVNLQQSRARNAVSLIAARGTSKILNQSQKILFPYDEFVELFNWEKPGFPPCGLVNCGNSCFANVVLQCLAYTRPLVAYLLEKGHRRECRRNDWCFLCELENHVARASQSMHAISPINFLSRLPNIGGNLGYGKQEDAHEFMRFAIDTMQSICLDEFGGEKAVHPSAQETTLIQHIFGGHLQSQVICTKCNNVSDQCENMMDLTVEIQGDASSLEECLDQFTYKEWLHGDNKYKCDGCNDYVLAWKRLTIRRAPNILTIALKRFQTGRFGKLNKRVTFPETLDLTPYMSGVGDGNDVYKLYAVVVHVDMLNASFFGHYICYTKDFSGNWYRIDDCKVCTVELDEVLSQGAYMLLYSRVCARQSCLNFIEEPSRKEQKLLEVSQEVLPYPNQPAECFPAVESVEPAGLSGSLQSNISPQEKVSGFGDQLSSVALDVRDLDMVDLDASTSASMDIEAHGDGCFDAREVTSSVEHANKLVTGANSLTNISTGASFLKCESPFGVSHLENGNGAAECVSVNSLIEGNVATHNHVSEKVERSCDISLSTSSVGEEVGKVVSEKHVGKLDGTNSSGAKLKPIFAPGFVEKRPRNRYAKRDGNTHAELGEIVSSDNPNDQSDGFLKPGFLCHHNGRPIKGEEKPNLKYIAPTSTPKGEEALNVVEMVANESLDLSNGISSVAVVPDEMITDNIVKDERSLGVEEASSRDGESDQRVG